MQHRIHFVNRAALVVVLLTILILPPQISEAQSPVVDDPPIAPTAVLPPAAPVGLARAFSGGPRYDSGWISLAQGETKTLTHNLAGLTDHYVVDMQFRGEPVDGINQRYYGGNDFGTSPAPGHSAEDRVGAYWRSLTTASITVYRRPEDTYAAQVRIRIWVDASPDYASVWTNLTVDVPMPLTHNLGGSVDDYVVDVQFKSATSGVNQRYYGGSDHGSLTTVGDPNDRVGAYWRSLTNTTITVYRRPEDIFVEQVRVRIWVRPQPTYTSNWVTIGTDEFIPLTHNIGGSADDYQVVMDFKSGSDGINQRYYGGVDFGSSPPLGYTANNRVGAYWRSLTNTSIVIYRRPQDGFAPQIRIRIFRYWKVTPPDYDSGWRAVGADSTLTLSHNLGGDAFTYMVDMQYQGSSADGINQRYYGGKDFGASPVYGHSADDRVGAYWRNLTSTSITVYRRTEDSYAAQVRIRIWKMPKPDYDSDWQTVAAGGTATLTHNLGGDYTLDYLVYFDCWNSTDGLNQRYYGGADFGTWPAPGHAANDNVGAYWRQLNGTTVAINRGEEDTYATHQRLRIWRVQAPAYNSNWVEMTVDVAQTLNHNLGGTVGGYLVQMTQWDTSSINLLNHAYYGGADFGNDPPTGFFEDDRVGSYWRSLTNKSITIYRRPEDTFADYVMVRIWNAQRTIYLPVINK